MKNNNGAIYLLSVMVLISIILSLFVLGGFSNLKKDSITSDDLELAISDIPVYNASELASLIVIPESENKLVQDLWESEYSFEANEIKDEAYLVALDKLEDDSFEDLEEFLEDSIEGVEKIKYMDVKDFEVEVAQYGLYEDEDKEADVYFKVKFKYTLESGITDQFKSYVYVSYNVLFDEGDFSDEDVSDAEYSFKELSVFA